MINQDLLISIILPVYNVQDYVEKCLISICEQTYLKFECLIVDDGSLDGSIDIAKKIVENDKRFKFYHKKNGGLSSARNYGLNFFKGQYVVFVDSDDYLDCNFLEKLLNSIVENNSDISVCDINYVDEGNNVIDVLGNDIDRYIESRDYLNINSNIKNFAWNKLFKRELFSCYRFNENIRYHEDLDLIYKVIFQKKISYVAQPLYYYVQRMGSLSKVFNERVLLDKLTISDGYLLFAKKHNFLHRINYIKYAQAKLVIYRTGKDIVKYSNNYLKDMEYLKKSIDPNLISFKNIINILFFEWNVAISLLLIRLSPQIFYKLFVYRNKKFLV